MPKKKLTYSGFKPLSVSDAVWQAVVDAWQNGLSDREAAFRASKLSEGRIKESTIKEWKHKNPDVAELCEFLQADILSKAKLTIAKQIEEGDVRTAKWYLERKAADEFSTKAAVAFEGAAIDVSIEDKERKMKEFMKQFGVGESDGE